MRSQRPTTVYLSAVLVALLALSLVACDNKNKIPGDAEGRVEALAQRLPASTEAVVFVGDIGKMQDTVNKLKDNIGGAVPSVEATQKQVASELGFDPLDAEAWKKAGVPIEKGSGLALAFHQNRSVLMVFVEDRQKFDATLTEKFKKAAEIEGAPKTETIDDKEVKILGSDPKNQIAWLHYGKLAIIGTPVLDEKFGGEKVSRRSSSPG